MTCTLFSCFSIQDTEALALKERTLVTKRINRLCMHEGPSDRLHVMLICLPPNYLIPLHASREPGQIFYIHHTGNIRFFGIGPTAPFLDNVCTALSADRLLSRGQENMSNNLALFWEITIGPHTLNSTHWL